jgi:hypothetical protein
MCIELRQSPTRQAPRLQRRHVDHGVFGEHLRHKRHEILLILRYRQPLFRLDLEATSLAGKIADVYDITLT